MNAPLTPHDWEFLSAYLDGQLSLQEQHSAQDMLARRPELAQALEELRRTRDVLRAAPRRRAPRNFTLTPAMARQARPRFAFLFGWKLGWAPSLSFASALAVLMLVLSFFVRLPTAGLPAAPVAAPAAQAPLALQAGRATQENSGANEGAITPIIIWNEGGRGAGAPPGAGGSPDVAMPPDAAGGQVAGTPAATLPGDNAFSPKSGTTVETTPTPPDAALTTPPNPAMALAPSAPDTTSSATGPILGVAPTEEQGHILTPGSAAQDRVNAVHNAPVEPQDNWIWVQLGLALIALLSGLAAWWLWRRARP